MFVRVCLCGGGWWVLRLNVYVVQPLPTSLLCRFVYLSIFIIISFEIYYNGFPDHLWLIWSEASLSKLNTACFNSFVFIRTSLLACPVAAWSLTIPLCGRTCHCDQDMIKTHVHTGLALIWEMKAQHGDSTTGCCVSASMNVCRWESESEVSNVFCASWNTDFTWSRRILVYHY